MEYTAENDMGTWLFVGGLYTNWALRMLNPNGKHLVTAACNYQVFSREWKWSRVSGLGF